MNKFDIFISSLTDHELAILVRYRYRGLLENSKQKINEEVKNRNLSVSELNRYSRAKLIAESAKGSKQCVRCGSEKWFEEHEYSEKPFNEFLSVEVVADTHRCMLCGYNPFKETPKNFFQKLKRVFSMNKKNAFINGTLCKQKQYFDDYENIKNPARINKRREKMGLNPIEEHLKTWNIEWDYQK